MPLHSDGVRRRPWLRILTSRHAVVVAFVAVAATELAHHEMWLDELNPWVIARDAHSLRELFFNMRFEPHPALWYLCLFAITRFTRSPVAMQALHGAIGAASVALLAYRSPFRLRDVWLLAFGYYIVFEYCAISRGYALGILLALTSCSLASAPRPRVVVIAVLLALLANTSVFGLILACSLALAIAPLSRVQRRRDMVIACGILLVGVGLSSWTLMPAPGNTFGRERNVELSLARIDEVSMLLGTAYFPLPNFTTAHPWNSSLLISGGRQIPRVGHFAPATAGLVVFVLALVHLRRRPSLVAALAIGSMAMLALMYMEYSGGYRHHGHLFVLLILAVWLAAGFGVAGGRVPRWFSGVLAIQVVAGLFFIALDFTRPFSASKDLARFLADRPHGIPIVVAQPNYLSYTGPALSGYLNERVYYAIATGVVRGSYLWYDDVRVRGASEDQIVGEIEQFARDLATDVYVVVNHWNTTRLGTRAADLPQNTIEGDERTTVVYLFKRPA